MGKDQDEEVLPLQLMGELLDIREKNDQIVEVNEIVSLGNSLFAVADTSPYKSAIGIVKVVKNEDVEGGAGFESFVSAPIILPVASNISTMSTSKNGWLHLIRMVQS